MPTRLDITVWRGNSLPPIAFPWSAGYSPGSAGARLGLWVGADELFSVYSGAGLVIDTANGRFLWDITIDQSRLVPLGTVTSYEIEDLSGGEQTILYGFVTGTGGSNDDTTTLVSAGTLNFSTDLNSGWL